MVYKSLVAIFVLLVLLPASHGCSAQSQNDGDKEGGITIYDVRIVNTFPHDTDAFTQGLFFANGTLYESTGQVGRSKILKRNLESGEILDTVDLPREVFGEGATSIDDRVYSLTWHAGIGFVHDLDGLELKSRFHISGEGWGLTFGNRRLILSDGSSTLRFLNPETFATTDRLKVTLNGDPVRSLNELEWVNDEIWANVWQQDVILRINPKTGIVSGVIDVSSLFPSAQRTRPREDVPNGIAYDTDTKRLIVTGKRWPHFFEITVHERK